MANKKESAFPNGSETGLTKREWIAAIAMQGILAAMPEKITASIPETNVAALAVGMADALEKELSKKN